MVRNFQATLPVETPATGRLERRQSRVRLICEGDWTISEVTRLDTEINALRIDDVRDIEIDASALTSLDSAGGWLLLRTKREAEAAGAKTTLSIPDKYKPL